MASSPRFFSDKSARTALHHLFHYKAKKQKKQLKNKKFF